MALHRDIYWIGRQWAVTGFGLQAVDQRLQGAFDLESSQVWDEGLQARIRSHAWVNGEDFDKALRLARQRFPDPARKDLPLVESVLELIQPMPVASEPPKPALSLAKPVPSPMEVRSAASPMNASVPPAQPRPIELPAVKIPLLAWRVERASAKFLPQWRIRH